MNVRVGLLKKPEHRRIDGFELWCWRRLLRVPWTTRRLNQSILKEISPGISLEGMMLKLKLQYFGHFMPRVDSLEKTMTLGKIEGGRRRDDRGWDGWIASETWWIWVWVNSRSWWWTGRPGVLQSVGSQSQTRLSNWTYFTCPSFQSHQGITDSCYLFLLNRFEIWNKMESFWSYVASACRGLKQGLDSQPETGLRPENTSS